MQPQIIACPRCSLEVAEHAPRCPRCNAVIDRRITDDASDVGFPTLDENSGRVEPETLPPPIRQELDRN